ncbi:hypothetical protein OPT61_g6826 [Boeremia exigua]|uniref:Uncharacterized protein n=1 Tax=Boeremia exigua TaxID=749465 RepID=A0ACC2I4N0_9PLEO|nr:hypothetical protein OPT61_g6826 [Boeremia exigua]
METSEYFERTLFYDRSLEADIHYEACAGLVFEEHCVETPVEVRVQTSSGLYQDTIATTDDIRKRTSDILKPATKPTCLSSHQFRETSTIHDDSQAVAPENTKPSLHTWEKGGSDSYDTCSISSRGSSTALASGIDQRRGSSGPPLYPGRAKLSTLHLAPRDVENFVHETKNDFRVFYLRQRHSYSRLQITKETFEQLLNSCHVFPRFTEYVIGLCSKTSDAEVGPPPLKFRPLRSANDHEYRGFECCYILRYVEMTQRGRGRKPWSLRQFAVYHRYKPAQISPCSTWILAGVSQCTEALLNGYTRNVRDLVTANPFELHMVFLDKCITNWRPYLAHLTRMVQEQSGKSSGFTLSGDQAKNFVTITVEDHQQLKEIEDDVADLIMCLDSSLDTLTSFTRMYEEFQRHRQGERPVSEAQRDKLTKTDTVVVAFKEKAQEVMYTRKKAESLLSKIQNTRKLVSSLLERQSAFNINQQIGALQSLERQGQQENKSMRQLTEKSSRDSSSMRILTIITMIYLPCTIVSNFFSTQFVNQIQLDTGGLTLQYAQNTWLFFAISIPLTAFTILVWFLWVSLSTVWEHRNSQLQSDSGQAIDLEKKASVLRMALNVITAAILGAARQFYGAATLPRSRVVSCCWLTEANCTQDWAAIQHARATPNPALHVHGNRRSPGPQPACTVLTGTLGQSIVDLQQERSSCHKHYTETKRKHFWGPAKMSPQFTDVDEVFNHIQTNMEQTTFRGERQRFLKQSAFEEITTEETIRFVAKNDDIFWANNEQLDKFVDQVVCRGKRLFATCIQGGVSMNCLRLLLDRGSTDADMPLTKDDCPGTTFKRSFVSCFVPNQAFFTTAYFHMDQFQDMEGLTKPIDYDENRLIGKGAFGSVYKIQIHDEHRSFGGKMDEFAMKVTQQKGTRELAYHKAMADLCHPHLVKCLTSFTFASQYHMIYEKADGNLEEFMQTHKNASKVHSLSPQYLGQQLAGLCGAVVVIHTQSSSDGGGSRLGVPNAKEKSGYLHDIKPDNLLVFLYEKRPFFRLSDFSCAKVVDFVASVSGVHKQSWQSTSKSGTPIYRAPESTTEGKTSRPYDIWSLGCVFLEVLVWYIEGYEGLLAFRKSRFHFVKPSGIEDEGFYYIDGNSKAHLREQVADRLKAISPHCKGALRTIAELIPRMMDVDPRKRPTAEQLMGRLKEIGQPSQPSGLSNSTKSIDLSEMRTNLPASPTFSSESDSDFGPIINIKVQNPTDE